jgi:Protein of unknown function (DUF2971)
LAGSSSLTVPPAPVFVGDDFRSSHPELHHYTTFGGLSGIIRSNSIWASHFSELNDTTEVTHLREPFARAMSRVFFRTLSDRQRMSLRVRRAVKQSGGLQKSADDLARDLVNSIYKVTFEDNDEFSFGEPFIASFCSHSGDQPYEQKHGLLSQWRGYGGGGGFCIVFDTSGLGDLLSREWAVNYWTHLNISAVNYATDDLDVRLAFSNIIALFNTLVEGIIEKNSPPPMEDAFAPFVSGATLFKHQGFKEEREVRIVAIPSPRKLRERQLSEYPDLRLPPVKHIGTRVINGRNRRYIGLFGFPDSVLPIKRVIVGPSSHQQNNSDKARALLGGGIEITVSATPFIGTT